MSIVKDAQFVGSFAQTSQCPESTIPEYAFIGRSNVGKSSLVNYLTGRKSLAKVSGTPGKTRLLNFFIINNNWHLVDLPGYGYARVSKTSRAEFNKTNQHYLTNREQLTCLFVLIDVSISPQKIDMEFINWVGDKGLPFAIIYTKADKISKTKIDSNIASIQKELKKSWEELPPQFVTTASKRSGKDAVLEYIDEVNKEIG
ncbi:MAG: ribosome biogenesis GTP-binding protein YihA/YsxC [Chitinophagales bacterium]|nr:ribosome biogenesis GTP-binding protein YihA/YsxC [Chitinophagales bacterium]